jgi:hypothetical protein
MRNGFETIPSSNDVALGRGDRVACPVLYMARNSVVYSVIMDTTLGEVLKDAFSSNFFIEQPLGIATKRENMTAQLLVLLDYPKEIANDYRTKLHLKNLLQYPSGSRSFADLDDFIYALSQKRRDTVFEGAELIVLKYGLTSIWMYPFAIAILTGHLPLLPDSGIRLHSPESTPMKKLSASVWRDIAANNYSVLIEVTRQVKLEDIRRFLKENKNDIKKAVKYLPIRPMPKVEASALFWGYLAELVHRDNPAMKWPGILELLDNAYPDFKTPAKPRNYDDLRQNHRSYIKSIKAFKKREQNLE